MTRFLGASRIATGILVAALVSVLPAAADDKYSKSDKPVFPAVQADRALVYIARTQFQRLIPLPTFKVLIDAAPAGWLPQRSYLAVQVDPGQRLLWGPGRNDSRRFDFTPGQTYLLLLMERYGPPNNSLLGTSWVAGDPADVKALVADKDLSYVATTAEAMAKLTEEGAREFQKESKQAPDTAAASQPATFETVWYRPGKRGFSLKAYDATGTLTVGTELIEFKSDKKTLAIAVKDIQSVSYDKVTGAANFADPNRWGIVKFGAAGEVAAFRDGHGLGLGGDSEKIYSTIRSAMQTPQGSTAASSPQEHPPAAENSPEGFVPYEGLKQQFTIALPEGWTAYDQSRALKGTPGRFGIVFFLPSKDLTSDTAAGPSMPVEVMVKVDTGEVPSFFVQREAAGKGMSCTGFSEKAQKALVDLIGKDTVFKKNALEPAHAEPASVGGCKGVRVRAKSQPQNGSSWVADAYMASDGETLYVFSLRNRSENIDKNAEAFHKAVSTIKLSAVK